jgi:hypothetical protein
MEPITTALAGAALLKSAVSGMKSAIGTANDVKDIAGFLDQVFLADKQHQQKRNAAAKVGALDGFKDAASSVIENRLHAEMMSEVRQMIQMRFGVEAWNEIIQKKTAAERAAKEAAAAEAKEKARKAAELESAIKSAAIAGAIIAVAVTLFVILFMSVAKSQAEVIIL